MTDEQTPQAEYVTPRQAWNEGWDACMEYVNGPDWGTASQNPYPKSAPTPQTPDDAGGLNALAATIRQVNADNGWTATDDTPTATIAVLALITAEVAEAIEEVRNETGRENRYTHLAGCPVSDWHLYGSTVGDSEPGCTCTPKPEGLPSEVADIIIRSLDFCASRGIDIDKAVAEKVAYNRTRSHRHGGKAL